MTHSPWLTLNEAADYTKLSLATITRARKIGDLRGYKVQGCLVMTPLPSSSGRCR